MVFDGWFDVARVGLTALVIYAALIAILRVAGKRSLAKLNIFDLVVTVALGSVLASIILTKDISWSEGIAAFVALAGLQRLVSWVSVKSEWFKQVIRSDARLLLKDGKFLYDNMLAERVTQTEVEAAIRKKGHGSIERIAAVVLETDGDFSVIENPPASQYSALEPLLKGESDSEGS